MRRLTLAALMGVTVGLAGVGVGTYAKQAAPGNPPTQNAINIGFQRDAATPDVNVTEGRPGQAGSVRYDFANEGGTAGNLSFVVEKVADSDGTCTEPEGLAEPPADTLCNLPGGELDDHLTVTLSATGGAKASATYTLSDWVAGGGRRLAAGLLGRNQSGELTIAWAVPAGTGNVVQGDSASFRVRAVLEQTSPAR